MVTCLVTLPNLEDLSIRFWYYESHPFPTIQSSTHWPKHGWKILPSLSKFGYRGPAAYPEDFVARISAPLLDSIRVAHYDSIIFPNHSHWQRLCSFIALSDIFGSLALTVTDPQLNPSCFPYQIHLCPVTAK